MASASEQQRENPAKPKHAQMFALLMLRGCGSKQLIFVHMFAIMVMEVSL